jgi:hypothetical protein
VDLLDHIRVLEERRRGPERQRRAHAAPLELGAGGAVKQEQRSAPKPSLECATPRLHAPVYSAPHAR